MRHNHCPFTTIASSHLCFIFTHQSSFHHFFQIFSQFYHRFDWGSLLQVSILFQIMSLPDSETLMKTVLEKYPDATDLKEDIDVHMEEFKAFEYRFKLTNVVLRALTLPIPKLEDESEVVFEGRSITYHWTFCEFWNGENLCYLPWIV